jgi:hypothetical protein
MHITVNDTPVPVQVTVPLKAEANGQLHDIGTLTFDTDDSRTAHLDTAAIADLVRRAEEALTIYRPDDSQPPEAQTAASTAPSLFSWDWRQQPPMQSIAAKVRDLSGGTAIITEIDTQSDERMIAVAGREVSTDEALAAYVQPLDRE